MMVVVMMLLFRFMVMMVNCYNFRVMVVMNKFWYVQLDVIAEIEIVIVN